jgi:methyltransferase-like protein/2-polyprenyl-3-methyl-5-hydroxy-6-metoxy-1,4-benzoquinol methylase
MSGPEHELTSYDAVPYGATVHPTTHPDRLATIATLFGATPPDIGTCRVLELGCARGGNLIPLAVALPNAQFVGVDLSGNQIEYGRRVVDELRLPNIELKHASILDVDAGYGEFDYVLCHGVYAWVPREVQDKILSICAMQLSPHGVAQISYNTYPGWHFRGMVREMLLYHSSGFSDPSLRISAARALLGFLAESSGRESPYGRVLNEELDLLAKLPDYYLFHEHLESTNQPLYFHEFAARATEHGLQYLGDADPPTMGHFNFPEKVQQVLARLAGSVVQAEQYMDFLRNRMFRQTLLVKQDAQLSRTLQAGVLGSLWVGSRADAEDGAEPGETVFRGPGKEALTTRDPVLRQALVTLRGHRPAWVPFTELTTGVAASLNAPISEVTRSLGLSFLRLYLSSRLVELHVAAPSFVSAVSERPVASALARLQAGSGTEVTNLRHETVRLGDLERFVLRRLDGSTTRGDILPVLLAAAADGSLTVPADQDAAAVVDEGLDAALGRLAAGALLVA